MNKIFFLILLSYSVNISAQTNTTKEDALAFINKVTSTYKYKSSITKNNYVFSLEGCNLSWNRYGASSVDGFYDDNTYTMDLSKVYIDYNSIKSIDELNYHPIYNHSISYMSKHSGKLKKMKEYNIYEDYYNIYSPFEHGTIEGSVGDNYDQRYLNAFKFLIEQCGGGKKQSGNSKF